MDWLMLIGENATGKSSLLQAMALNLMSDADRDRLGLMPRQFIRRGTTSARVEVCFRGGGTPRVLTISQRAGFKCSDPKAGAPLMAYGATRLPPQSGMSGRTMLLQNLFDPFAPLGDAVAWLLKLAKERPTDFDYAARALKSLLPVKQKCHFRAARNDIIVDPEGPLRQLSDGYQSVIALAADIMATLHHSFRGGMEAAEGIVLLDELGAHLHPRWKMRVTKVLREAFPRLQFIVTTHDPLCLRGLRNGEIVTMEKTVRGRVFTRTELPPIEGMRVDQILQSEYFGLRSAMDPDIEAMFDRMYRLKAKPSSLLSPKQRKELAQLEEQLAPFEVLGSTRSERLMLSEINRFLAAEREQPHKEARDRAWAVAQKQIAARLKKELGIRL
jgi:energy-coupling factor transporter ATP-binding protein EcfA2